MNLSSHEISSLLAQLKCLRHYVSTLPLLLPKKSRFLSRPQECTSSPFGDLVAVLTQLRAETGEEEFRFSSITPLLLKKGSKPYTSAGISRVIDYINLANGERSGQDQTGDATR
jgi:hypothetical protein